MLFIRAYVGRGVLHVCPNSSFVDYTTRVNNYKQNGDTALNEQYLRLFQIEILNFVSRKTVNLTYPTHSAAAFAYARSALAKPLFSTLCA